MATKRGERSKHELVNLARPAVRKEDEFIERLVLPTDTLQGIALLYNTSVGEIKKLNNLHKDVDLHARRIIKVPSKGILIDLTEPTVAVPSTSSSSNFNLKQHKSGATRREYHDLDLNEDGDDDEFGDAEDGGEDSASTNGQVYLNNVDSVVQEIKEKAESVAANSIVLAASDNNNDDQYITQMRKRKEDLSWWKLALFCIILLILLPYLYFLYLEYLKQVHNTSGHNTST